MISRLYLITNLVNDMKYVGQTSKDINDRWKEHLYGHLCVDKVIREIGPDNFSLNLIEEYHKETKIPMALRQSKENAKIVQLKSYLPEIGYNRNYQHIAPYLAKHNWIEFKSMIDTISFDKDHKQLAIEGLVRSNQSASALIYANTRIDVIQRHLPRANFKDDGRDISESAYL